VERKDWIEPTGGGEKAGTARLAVLTALGLATLKGVTFLVTGSVAVLASAVDSLMDVLASGVNLLAIRFADEPEDAGHSYGHGKVEGLAGLLQCLLIGVSAGFLVYESVHRLLSQRDIERPMVGIGVMLLSMAVTLALVKRMRRVAAESESIALKADSLHYLSDVLANAAVLLALAAYHITGARWPDPVVSLLICGWILWSVTGVFREAWDNLMDRQLPEEEQEKIMEIISARVPGVLGHHDLRTRRSGARRFVVVHVEIDRNVSFLEAHRLAEAVTREIEEGLANCRATVHADPWPPDPEAEPDRAG
jgi:ferrous-iron efflux pump FieF